MIVTAEDVAREISQRQCISFVGAGFSAPYGMPSWGGLLRELIIRGDQYCSAIKSATRQDEMRASLEAASTALAKNEFTYCASLLKASIPASIVAAFVKGRFRQRSHYPALVTKQMRHRLESLLRLPNAGIITTNYDNVIDNRMADVAGVRICLGTAEDLGGLLSGNRSGLGFYLKVHGDLGGNIVFSSEEYDDVYLRQTKVRSFIKAAMLRFPFLFIGCSMESEILRIRRELYLEFGPSLPKCFYIAAESRDSKVRADWLGRYAAVSSILYSNIDGTHSNFDVVLSEVADRSNSLYQELFGLRPSGSVQLIVGKNIAQKKKLVGELNRKLAQRVRSLYRNSASWSDILSLRTQVPDIFGTITETELMYRAYYLVAVGLLAEFETSDGIRIRAV